jgi:hypothetical protein
VHKAAHIHFQNIFIVDVFSLISPSLKALRPVVQEIQTKTHKNTKNSKNVLFKPLALYMVMAMLCSMCYTQHHSTVSLFMIARGK